MNTSAGNHASKATQPILNRRSCERARRARDARFDGKFFTAVKTTGVYCRPICPANQPLEKNVDYYSSAIAAAHAGFRPCLRCRPDSAPQSWAWLGSQTTFQRALSLIQKGALQGGSIESLANRLGISDRYLRELFQENLGTSPKKYAVYQQCLFAKQLLHESSLPVTQIAFAAGFNSVRRFNEAMQQQIGLTPSDIRKSDKVVGGNLSLKLYYRPPFAWPHLFNFLQSRCIDGLEWTDTDSYSRTIQYGETRGYFSVSPVADETYLKVDIQLDDYHQLNPITQRLRSLFDVDAPVDAIDRQLRKSLGKSIRYLPGLRVPGIWDTFEAGARAVLGQQVSVVAARHLVTTFIGHLGEEFSVSGTPGKWLFPQASAVVDHNLDFFRMPQSRKDTLRRLAQHVLESEDPNNIDDWLAIKGIGPWTVAYTKMRAVKDPDVWLAGDAGIKNALKLMSEQPNLDAAKPWRSYLSMQLWNQL